MLKSSPTDRLFSPSWVAGSFTRLSTIPWAAETIALLAGAAYIVQSWMYAHTQESVLDEGTYLTKGLLFFGGQYKIYQDYGPWSNHMPLAFFIPGALQRLFGPGLRTGRYFAIIFGILALIGLWILANRLGNRWWATGAVLAVSMNPAVIKIYSLAVTQVIIALLFIWMLVLVLGEGRSLWQIALASTLATIMILTRINLVPILPLLVLYVFWQHGSKAGLVSALVGGLTFVTGHALFWPGILKIWAYWLPGALTPFLDKWRIPENYARYWDPNISASGRILSFFHGIRFNFAAIVGTFSTWLLWPRRNDWKKPSDFRAAVFLSGLFLSLLMVHIWATLGKDYCVFCLSGYITFFAVTGLLLVILSFSAWRRKIPVWHQAMIAILLLGLSTGVGFGAFEDIGNQLLSTRIPRFILGESPLSGSAVLEEILLNRYPEEHQFFRRFVPAAAGFGAGILILGTALILKSSLARAYKSSAPAFGFLALVIFLTLGMSLSPTIPLGGGYQTYACGGDVIDSFEAAGERLAQVIPPGSKVYWKGGLSSVPLLYVPGVEIYPAQLNGDYSFYLSGDSDTLLRFGFWNDELARKWASEADFILVQMRYYKGWLKDIVNSGAFDELERTPPTLSCRDDAQIRIFRRKS